MAFQNKNLSVIAYANGFTLWHYAEDVAMATITGAKYFDSVKTLMNTGDIVIVNASDTTALKKVAVSDGGVGLVALG